MLLNTLLLILTAVVKTPCSAPVGQQPTANTLPPAAAAVADEAPGDAIGAHAAEHFDIDPDSGGEGRPSFLRNYHNVLFAYVITAWVGNIVRMAPAVDQQPTASTLPPAAAPFADEAPQCASC
eukprot:NODE_15609_length_1041_cov_1.850109.p2 GENE.NODE_15609_length_1041_cov_1.850109~~NODE_15609_length_1041_cov_1.850109.p2  ORF type:complete len:123 (+),score=23.91 NODE_15609_length_1041_cov_1.850109:110-478(+)